MKLIISSVLLFFGVGSVFAQVPGAPPPQSSYGGYAYTNRYMPNQSAATTANPQGGMTFTLNGQTYSVDQLASQLQNLQRAVDQALPALAAFNANYISGNAAGNPSLGGTISNLLSDVLHRNNSTQMSPAIGNLVAALQGQPNGSAPATAAVNANTTRNLVTLQSDLNPLPQLFQGLGMRPGTAPNPSQVISSPAYPGYGSNVRTNGYRSPYAPTGR